MSGQEIVEGSYRDLPAVVDSSQFMPIMGIKQALERRQAIVDFTKQCMKEGHDYGTIPGTNKPTLYKPGAEKLCSMFGLTPKFHLDQCEEDWTGERHGGEPFFYYRYSCSVYRGDFLLADSEGSCNSWEKKYRYRRVFGNKATKEERERGKAVPGKFGMDYLLPNEETADLVNTFQKMGQKRAMVAAVLLATNASEFYTQDLEDLTPAEVVHEAPMQAAEAVQQPEAEPIEWKPLFDKKAAENGITKITTGLVSRILGRKLENVTDWDSLYQEALQASDEKWKEVAAILNKSKPAEEKPLAERIVPASLSPGQHAAFDTWMENYQPDRQKFSEVVGRELPCNEIGFGTLSTQELADVNVFLTTGAMPRKAEVL